MSFGPLDVIENKFYFGIGGMGDFLLLMSTFYDDIEDNTDVIFVCNNVHPTKELAKKFPLVKRWWFWPRSAFALSSQMWDKIVEHPLCLGTGVTPKKFNYVEDWIKCGETSVFDYYGVKHHPYFGRPMKFFKEDYICIQPFGGADDSTKLKEIDAQEVCDIIWREWDKGVKKTIIIGSKSDIAKLPMMQVPDVDKVDYVTDISKSYEFIRGCTRFYGADSWGKTVACFAGRETFVYPNVYAEGRGPMEMFNHPVDPGNYVFLHNWNITRMD